MASITISGLSDESLERLEKRAAVHGRSVEDEVVHILKQAIGPDREEREARMKKSMEELRLLREKQREWESEQNVEQIPSEKLIRKMRGHED